MKRKELFRIPLKQDRDSFVVSEATTFILVRDKSEVICRGLEMMKQLNAIEEELGISRVVAVEMLYQFLLRCISCTNTVKITADSKGYMYLEWIGSTDSVRMKRNGKSYTIFDEKYDLMRRYQFEFEKDEKAIMVYEMKVELEYETATITRNTITVNSERAEPNWMEFTFKGIKNEEKEIALFLGVIRFLSLWKCEVADSNQIAKVLKERICEIMKRVGYEI